MRVSTGLRVDGDDSGGTNHREEVPDTSPTTNSFSSLCFVQIDRVNLDRDQALAILAFTIGTTKLRKEISIVIASL